MTKKQYNRSQEEGKLHFRVESEGKIRYTLAKNVKHCISRFAKWFVFPISETEFLTNYNFN
jgi:hypothetical protein